MSQQEQPTGGETGRFYVLTGIPDQAKGATLEEMLQKLREVEGKPNVRFVVIDPWDALDPGVDLEERE